MSIGRKIAEIQHILMAKNLPKSGHSSYGNFDYHELEDILPLIQQECYKRDLILLFDFPGTQAILDVCNQDNLKDYVRFTIPLPAIEKMPRMNIMQSEGSYITFLKKYLLGNAFLTLEKSLADIMGEEESDSTKVKETPIIKEKSVPSIPKPVNDALIKLDAEGKDINSRTVWAAIDKSAFEGNTDLKKECMSYVSAHIGKGGK